MLYKLVSEISLINYIIETIISTILISCVSYNIRKKYSVNLLYKEVFIIVYIDILLILIIFPDFSLRMIEIIIISLVMVFPLFLIPIIFTINYKIISKIYHRYYISGNNKLKLIITVLILNVVNIIKSVIILFS